MNYWILFSSLSALNYTMAIFFNVLVIYIMVFRFRLKGVDDLLSFILAVIDITYSLLGILNFCLYLIAAENFQGNRIYCIATRLVIDCTSTLGLNTAVVLAVVRYFAICKKIVLPKSLALIILLIVSSIPIAGLIVTIFNNQPKLAPETPICSIDIPFDSISNKILVWLNIHPLIYLAVITACYFQIMRYYSNMELVLSEIEATSSINSSIDTDIDLQTYKSSLIQSENSQKLSKTPSLTSPYKSRIFLPILKITIIIFIYYIELVPYYSIQIYTSITNNTQGVSELSVLITLLMADLIPLTNTFLILFIHEETWQELRLWGTVWANWIKKKF